MNIVSTGASTGKGTSILIAEDTRSRHVLHRARYDTALGVRHVSAVLASLRFGAEAGADFGFGERDDYTGDRVPLSACVA